MAKTPQPTEKRESEPWYEGQNIPLRVIRTFALAVAEKFQPEKIILFGSYAYGTPHADSDVDRCPHAHPQPVQDQAFQIRLSCSPALPGWTSIVRTPENLGPGGLRRANPFSHAGSCLGGLSCMKKQTAEWVKKAEGDHRVAKSRERAAELHSHATVKRLAGIDAMLVVRQHRGQGATDTRLRVQDRATCSG